MVLRVEMSHMTEHAHIPSHLREWEIFLRVQLFSKSRIPFFL